MANIELLDKVMQHIEDNEKLWDQTEWARLIKNDWSNDQLSRFVAEDPENPACGWTRCFAGHTVALGGWSPIFTNDEGRWTGRLTHSCRNRATGEIEFISVKARELLDLDIFTADSLFAGDNDLDDLRQKVELIKSCGRLARPVWALD